MPGTEKVMSPCPIPVSLKTMISSYTEGNAMVWIKSRSC